MAMATSYETVASSYARFLHKRRRKGRRVVFLTHALSETRRAFSTFEAGSRNDASFEMNRIEEEKHTAQAKLTNLSVRSAIHEPEGRSVLFAVLHNC